jgi:hypothetical protein
MAEKSVHVTLFVALAATLWCCLGSVPKRTTWTVVTGFALGCSSELFQRLFPTRDPTIRDVLINWCSVLLGIGCMHLVDMFTSLRIAPVAPPEYDEPAPKSLFALSSYLPPGAIPTAQNDLKIASVPKRA